PCCGSLLHRRHLAAELLEEVEDKGDVIGCGYAACGSSQHRKALAVRVEVEIVVGSDFGELSWRPKLRLSALEGAAGRVVGDHHDLVVRGAIKKLLAVARPLRLETTSGGDLPFTRAWKGRDIDFDLARLIGRVSHLA